MGEIKSLFFDIPTEVYDRFVERNQKKKLQISDYLTVISESLEKVGQKLESKELLTEDGHFLSEITKHATAFVSPFKRNYPELVEVFDVLLYQILSQIQIADYLIDGIPRGNATLSKDSKNVVLHMTPASQIDKAISEIRKAKGIISAHATRFRIDGK